VDIHEQWISAMRRGDFEAAWRATDRAELRRREAERAGGFRWNPKYLLWNGTPFDQRRVRVRCNHGLGDTLQFARFLPQLTAVAREVTVAIQPPLLELFQSSPSFGRVVDGWSGAVLPECDVEIEIMELAYAFRADAATVGRMVPYLPTSKLQADTRSLIPAFTGKRRIGVIWAASSWDESRSIPVSALAPLSEVADADFYSLQQGPQSGDWRSAPLGLSPISSQTTEIAAAAVAMQELDLVMTVDSMAAHLAGALGRPVMLLLKHDADWRWMRDRSDSPWYLSMRLFRQDAPGDWHGVVRKVAAALQLPEND
jgi:hypothetical protein